MAGEDTAGVPEYRERLKIERAEVVRFALNQFLGAKTVLENTVKSYSMVAGSEIDQPIACVEARLILDALNTTSFDK